MCLAAVGTRVQRGICEHVTKMVVMLSLSDLPLLNPSLPLYLSSNLERQGPLSPFPIYSGEIPEVSLVTRDTAAAQALSLGCSVLGPYPHIHVLLCAGIVK